MSEQTAPVDPTLQAIVDHENGLLSQAISQAQVEHLTQRLISTQMELAQVRESLARAESALEVMREAGDLEEDLEDLPEGEDIEA